jgi:hypothetical protein
MINAGNKVGFILLLLIHIFHFTSYSQSVFPEYSDNQKWMYIIWHFWGGNCETRIIKTAEKVFRCGKEYVRILDCNKNEQDCLIIGYYRISSDSVLIRTNYLHLNETLDSVICTEKEGLMYDFDMVQDEKVICQINSTFPPTFTPFIKTDEQFIQYEGQERKTISLNYIPYPAAPQILFQMKWISGIGSDIHPFYSLSCIGDHCEWEQRLYKVYRNDQLIFQNNNLNFPFPCPQEPSNTSDFQDFAKPYRITSNPSAAGFMIKSDDPSNHTISVSINNNYGRVLYKNDHQLLSDIIHLESIPPGVYFIRIQKEQLVQTLKWVKH